MERAITIFNVDPVSTVVHALYSMLPRVADGGCLQFTVGWWHVGRFDDSMPTDADADAFDMTPRSFVIAGSLATPRNPKQLCDARQTDHEHSIQPFSR